MKNLIQTIKEKILTIDPELETIDLIDQNLSTEAKTIELMRVEYFSEKLKKSEL